MRKSIVYLSNRKKVDKELGWINAALMEMHWKSIETGKEASKTK